MSIGEAEEKNENRKLQEMDKSFSVLRHLQKTKSNDYVTIKKHLNIIFIYLLYNELSVLSTALVLSSLSKLLGASVDSLRKELSTTRHKWISTPCYLYILHCVGTDFYKIGISYNVEKRVYSIRSCPYEIEIFYRIGYSTKKDARKAENIAHKRYSHCSVRGKWPAMGREWFRFSPTISP